MKTYMVTVPVQALIRVVVAANTEEEAREKVLRGDTEYEYAPEDTTVDEHGSWGFEAYEASPAYEVDFKWSLWTTDESYWEERAPEAWKALQDLGEGQRVFIRTAPRKEIRFGDVRIDRTGKEAYRAEVHFRVEWDEPGHLADGLDVPEDRFEAFVKSLPFAKDSSVGVEIDAEVEASTLKELLSKIDEVEAELLENESAAWRELESSWLPEKK